MKCLFIQMCGLFSVSSGILFGQGKDSVSVTLPVTADRADSIYAILPNDTLHILPDVAKDSLERLQKPTKRLDAPKQPVLKKAQDSIPIRQYTAIDSLYFPIDSLKDKIIAYSILSENSYARTRVMIDTTLTRFEINNPVMRNYFAGAYLGNNGLSHYSIGFEKRKRPSDFLFTDNVSLYMHTPENTKYYQVKVPYTLLDYSSAGAKATNESMLNLVHTQNVNKQWNVGLNYDLVSSVGQYPNQNAADNAFSIFSAYRGKQYSLYANLNLNNIRMKENGGLANLEGFINVDGQNPGPGAASIRSASGKTILLNRSLYFMQSYSFKKLELGKKDVPKDTINDVSRFTLVHSFKYEWNKREFFDTATYVTKEPHFYEPALTHDSLYFRRIFNHFELMVKEQEHKNFTAGFSVGLLNELDRYNNNIVPETSKTIHESHIPSVPGWNWGDEPPPAITWEAQSIQYRHTRKYTNTALTGRFFNHTGRHLNWDFNGRFYFTGYKLGDLNINGTVQLHYYTPKGRNTLLVGGSIDNAKPSYFLNKYASNWLVWDNDFKSSQEIRLRGEFISPHRKLKIGAYVSQLNNHVYINSDALPDQTSTALLTGTAYIEKDIRWWKLGFRFRLYGQYSSNEEIIPLPAFAGYQSTYFETWLVRNVLMIQLGWDMNIHSQYYAYAYMPSSGMFHLQTEQKIGNYPFFDVFLNMQIKRARIFVRTEGLNTVLNNTLGKEYFMVHRYPLNEVRVKFGVSWAFYD